MTVKKSLENRIRGWLPKEGWTPRKTNTSSTVSTPKVQERTNYNASPSTRVGQRTTSMMGTNALFWGFLAAFQIMLSFSHSYRLSVQLVALACFAGASLGICFGLVASTRQLQTLSKKGEIRSSLSYVLFLVGGVTIAAGSFIFFAWNESAQAQQLLLDIVYVMVPAVGGTTYISYRQWEKKYRRLILNDRWWTGRVYVFPKIDMENDQSYLQS
jgi:hypothetical protein